jgi:hypothetical protein
MIEVFVGNLPSRASIQDVRELFETAWKLKPKGSLMARWGERLYRRLLQRPAASAPRFYLIESAQGRFPPYIRISAYPRQEGQMLITRLAGINLLGNTLQIREFRARTLDNDRRRAGWHFRRWLGIERRQGERRRAS